MRAPTRALGLSSGLVRRSRRLVDGDEVDVHHAVARLIAGLAVDEPPFTQTGIAVATIQQVVRGPATELRTMVIRRDDLEDGVQVVEVVFAEVVAALVDLTVETDRPCGCMGLGAVRVGDDRPEVVDHGGHGVAAVGLVDDGLDARFARGPGKSGAGGGHDAIDLGDGLGVEGRFGGVGVRLEHRGCDARFGDGHGLSHLQGSLHRIAGLDLVYAHVSTGQAYITLVGYNTANGANDYL